MNILPTIKTCAFVACAFIATSANAAVHLSPNKTGQVIIVPFYTVSNQMNTLLSLNNTRDETKAIKIHIKEANQGQAVASFNVYLAPQDMWTMGMGQFGGEFKMISFDSSCTTGFMNNEAIQTEGDWLWENGTMEIIEMGVVENINAIQDNRIDCETLSAYWQDGGTWAGDSETHLGPASGGLHTEVTLMDVEQGHAANIPVIHLDGFYGDDNIQHTPVGAETPNLASGTRDSLVLLDGEAITTRWPTGYEAISALLMKSKLYNEYNVEPGVAAKTDWIISMPTFFYHMNNPVNNHAPFHRLGDSEFIWFPVLYTDTLYFNREGMVNNHFPCGNCSPVPPEVVKHSINNFAFFRLPSEEEPVGHFEYPSPILTTSESNNLYYLNTANNRYDDNGTWSFVNGKVHLNLNPDAQFSSMSGVSAGDDLTTHRFFGLPVIGFSFTRFTNANAQPGLLAQYAFVREHFGEQEVVITGQ